MSPFSFFQLTHQFQFIKYIYYNRVPYFAIALFTIVKKTLHIFRFFTKNFDMCSLTQYLITMEMVQQIQLNHHLKGYTLHLTFHMNYFPSCYEVVVPLPILVTKNHITQFLCSFVSN